MAKIDLAKEVLSHEDSEIIEWLLSETKGLYNSLGEENLYELYHRLGSIKIMVQVLSEMNRRNKEKSL